MKPDGQRGNWDLIFSDEFDGSALDTDKWVTCYWWDRNGCTNLGNRELEWYMPENVRVDNGVLRLIAEKKTTYASDGRTYLYTSGMITTGRAIDDTTIPAKFAFQYGFAEIRAKVPAGKGLWPAFWFLPITHQSKPEIDVLEILGDETSITHMTYHYLNAAGGRERKDREYRGPDFSAGWHTFAVEWQPDVIIWYVDGVERSRFTETEYISAEPMYLLVNLAVGGNWPGAPDSNTVFPSEYLVDYVRVWKPGGDITLLPTADTHVDNTQPAVRFGEDDFLSVDGDPLRKAYLKFDLSSLREKKITSAVLRITTTAEHDSGSQNTQTVYLVPHSDWYENGLDFNTQLLESGQPLGSIGETENSLTYDIPLDPEILNSKTGETVTLAVLSDGGDGLYFYSKERPVLNPRLIVDAESSLTFDIPFIKNLRDSFIE